MSERLSEVEDFLLEEGLDGMAARVRSWRQRLEVAERLAGAARIALGNWHCGADHTHIIAALSEWDGALSQTSDDL